MIKILIADDHQLFRQGIASLLSGEKDLSIVGEAQNGFDIINQLTIDQPDVILMDIEMKGMDGLEATKKIKTQFPHIIILALTMHNRSGYIKQMIKAGASGFILKDAGKKELMKAIKTVCEGNNYYSQDVMTTVMENLSHQKDEGMPLSERELEIVRLIANEHTTTEIADMLHLSKLTVETHRKNILLKLGLRNVAGLIKYAFQKGWIE
jgi:DNA-binding NarL/FixJ family response regulator